MSLGWGCLMVFIRLGFGAVSWVPTTTPHSMIHWEISQDSTYRHAHSSALPQCNCKSQHLHREKVGGAESGRSASFPEASPIELQRMNVIPRAVSCDNMCAMLCTREARPRLRAQGFCWGWSLDTSVWHIPNFQTPEEKQMFNVNHIVQTL